MITIVRDFAGSSGDDQRTARRIGVSPIRWFPHLDAIEPFLFNLFCDPDIIDFPLARIGRKPLAKLISTTRAKKVQHHYSVIGGGSPIRRFTEQQASALETWLSNSGLDVSCFVAMRYWHPFTSEAVQKVLAAGCQELVLLPLYPHHSGTTTGSSLNEWRRRFDGDLPVHVIPAFYQNEWYLESLVEKVREALAKFPEPDLATMTGQKIKRPGKVHISQSVIRVDKVHG